MKKCIVVLSLVLASLFPSVALAESPIESRVKSASVANYINYTLPSEKQHKPAVAPKSRGKYPPNYPPGKRAPEIWIQ